MIFKNIPKCAHCFIDFDEIRISELYVMAVVDKTLSVDVICIVCDKVTILEFDPRVSVTYQKTTI